MVHVVGCCARKRIGLGDGKGRLERQLLREPEYCPVL